MSGATNAISIPQLRADLNGRVTVPGEPGYDEGRTVLYGGIDRRPAAIVRAVNPDDVSRVVTLARETGVELAIRSGGHSIPGHSTTDGGVALLWNRASNRVKVAVSGEFLPIATSG